MAIYRNINTSFWTDTKVADDFSPEDKYFMLYCLTNSYTNLCGCYEISIKQIARDTGYNEETIEKLLDRFENVHNIMCYNKENKELLIKNWYKYNWTKSEKLDKPLLKEIENIKTVDFKGFVADEYNKRDTVSIPYIYPMDTTVSVSDTVSDKKNNIKHKYGEYKNVLLKDEELEKLKIDYNNWQDLIKYLDEYIEMKGYKAKSHYLCIKKWVIDAVNKTQKISNINKKSNFEQREYNNLDFLYENK